MARVTVFLVVVFYFVFGFGTMPSYAADVGCLAGTSEVSKGTHEYLVKVFVIKDPAKPQESASNGSGELVRGTGGIVYILTNAHVTGTRASHAWVHFDGEPFAQKVKILGVDTVVDLALLEAPRPLPVSARPIPIATTSIKVGDCVYAAGYPNGVRTVSAGVVNALSIPQTLSGVSLFFNHQSPISPGSSGGALVRLNASGAPELVGINTQVGVHIAGNIRQISNFGLAIHARIVHNTIALLERRRYVEHAFAFMLILDAKEIDPMFFELMLGQSYPPEKLGATIAAVVQNSPVTEADILPGDIIRRFEARTGDGWFSIPFQNAMELKEEVFFRIPPGTRVRLTVERGAQTITREFTLGAYPAPKAKSQE